MLFQYYSILGSWYDYFEQHGGKDTQTDAVFSICIFLMVVLWALHIMWFHTICSAFIRALRGEEARDSRSDLEDCAQETEEEEEPDAKAKKEQ